VSALALPSPVMAKGKYTVETTLDAPGFVGKLIRLKVLLDGQEVAARNYEVENARNNKASIECDAPPRPGEYEVTVKVEDPPIPGRSPIGQVSDARNQLSTFLTVAKEGISVLLVDQSLWEPKGICFALNDKRIRVHSVELRGGKPIDANAGDLFQFENQQ